jgi:23S rRNA (adenine2030-N6)-methyltransferase
MNYRHAFHAGNAADVFKHVVLVQLLATLQQKPAAFCVIDSHAGRGEYTLERPGEFEQGVGLLWPEREQWPQLRSYFEIIERLNGPGPLRTYPGSPHFIRAALRPEDRAVLSELHPEEYADLKAVFAGDPRVAVHHQDAWHALKAFVPPKEKRGLALIDPPYEKPDEFARIGETLQRAVKHWRAGLYMVWYPLKRHHPVAELHALAASLGVEAYAVEFLTLSEDVPGRLNGSGLLLLNPPWKLRETLAALLPPLATRLAGAGGAPQVRFRTLAGI